MDFIGLKNINYRGCFSTIISNYIGYLIVETKKVSEISVGGLCNFFKCFAYDLPIVFFIPGNTALITPSPQWKEERSTGQKFVRKIWPILLRTTSWEIEVGNNTYYYTWLQYGLYLKRDRGENSQIAPHFALSSRTKWTHSKTNRRRNVGILLAKSG